MEAATTSAGVRILPDVTFAELGRADTVVVPGVVETDSHRRVRAVVAAVARLAEGARRVASVCVGAHILAVSGNGLPTQGGSAATPLAARSRVLRRGDERHNGGEHNCGDRRGRCGDR
ncbi:DJ-1/PfpI family protein [Nocardia salmonicida]|uniref:DJ-1/PfpI family protein n=1 Tax=Nocardia salmonicida TaxID=53431 RepID=UPI00378E431E